jgi:hypothetical protein
LILLGLEGRKWSESSQKEGIFEKSHINKAKVRQKWTSD